MDKVFDWSAPLVAATSRMIQGFLEYLPQLIGAAAILIVGWLVARMLKALTIRLANSFDRLSGYIGISNVIATKKISESVVVIIANVIFWLVILFFLTAATNLLGLTMFAGWLDRMIGHLPNILSGILIIFAGVVVGNIVRDATVTAAQAMHSRQRTLLARGAQIFTVATIIVIGIDQIGIDITVLITVIAIVIAAVLGGLAIAFSLGSRTLVSNLIGARYLNKDYRVGEAIRVGGIEGTVLEISPVAVILETAEGRMTVPAKIFGEESSILLHREQANVG
ncbi:MAG: mechanosensitive ion channel [Alphaproteobacteria bacterium]|nr:mechanosensitive ion channel [Alphaproteobacteria bacterium]